MPTFPTHHAISAAPPRAILIWADATDLYIELSGPHGPVVLRHPLTVSGLSAAIGILRTRRPDGLDREYRPPPPTIPFPGTSAQHDNATAVLRKLRMVP